MSEHAVRVYVGLMWIGAVACLATTDWTVLASLSAGVLVGLAGLVCIAIFSESLAIGLFSVESRNVGNSSITFLPLLASVHLFGPAGGTVLAMTTVSFAELVVRRKSLFRTSFNVAQAIVAPPVAGYAFVLLGGRPLHGMSTPDMTSQIWPFVSFGLLFLAINHAAVSLAITLSQGLPFRRVWHQVLSNSGASLND